LATSITGHAQISLYKGISQRQRLDLGNGELFKTPLGSFTVFAFFTYFSLEIRVRKRNASRYMRPLLKKS